jgi:mannose-1-phosphate guanylyltransferase
MKRTAVIMAGGSGERFWPLSRKKTTKTVVKS